MQYFRRDLEKELLYWKDEKNTVLKLAGARQVGKTTLLKRFGKENFKNVLYISLMEESGRKFKEIIDAHEGKVLSNFYVEIFNSFAKYIGQVFSNDGDTLVIIDEIQESKKIYEMIKGFYDNVSCRVIVTGSYLFQAIKCFQPVGCVTNLTLYPLNFLEFIDVFGKRVVLEKDFSIDSRIQYNSWYSRAFSVYCEIGGYPAVIQEYFKTSSLPSVRATQEDLISLIIQELCSRLENFMDNFLISRILENVVKYMVKEKRGGKLIKSFVTSLVENTDSLNYNKREVKNAIAILISSGVVSVCDKYDFERKENFQAERLYFNDLGILSYFLDEGHYDQATKLGIISENFVFKSLNEQEHSVKNKIPIFGITSTGELDFVTWGKDNQCYGIEVKHGNNTAKTGKSSLDKGLIQKLVCFKGVTEQTITEDINTFPIWLAPLVQFNEDFTATENNLLDNLSLF